MYTTRWYERPTDKEIPWRILFINARPPDIPYGGAIFQVEGGRWMATIAGVKDHHPPTDDEAWVEFTKKLATIEFYDAIKDAKPLTGKRLRLSAHGELTPSLRKSTCDARWLRHHGRCGKPAPSTRFTGKA